MGRKEFSKENMYSQMKTLTPCGQWGKYVETLISEANGKKDYIRLLFIYTQEKMWDKYMEYLRRNPYVRNIDDAPEEVIALNKDEIISIYTAAVRHYFKQASDRNSYREGVGLLRNLIKYGGKSEADKIVIEQKSRTPRRPALIDELSKL